MKRFILSDLHIGPENANYGAIGAAIDYVSNNADPNDGDEIWGLGDWFHIDDNVGLNACLLRPETARLITLAGPITTKLIPGNHDDLLKRYIGCGPNLPNPIAPIRVVEHLPDDPVLNNAVIQYRHGHQYDPAAKHLSWLGKAVSWLLRRRTPGTIDQTTKAFLAAVQTVHTAALLDARKHNWPGVVIGHTHLPLHQQPLVAGIPFLINAGDMRESATFLILDNGSFQRMIWDGMTWQSAAVQ